MSLVIGKWVVGRTLDLFVGLGGFIVRNNLLLLRRFAFFIVLDFFEPEVYVCNCKLSCPRLNRGGGDERGGGFCFFE